MVGNPLASWLSERISDAERMQKSCEEDDVDFLEAYWEGRVHALLEVEDYIANQESK